jgi:glycosyltransferase involved in cell wall biosynthesis
MGELRADAVSPRPVTFVVPPSIDDPAGPSGGNGYDRHLVAALHALGRPIRVVPAPGRWPRPAAADRMRLAATLAAVPAGGVVLLDGLVACAAPDVLEAHSRRLRLVVLVHLPLADETGLPPEQARALAAAERRALRGARGVVATSRATADRLRVVGHRRVTTAVPGADRADVTEPSPSGGRLLCVASVIPRKGHDVLLDALSRIAEPPWSLAVVGPLDRAPEFVAGVRGRAARLGEQVTFAGALTGRALDARYGEADLLVLASQAEPYGMVVAEALARAVPVVATDVGGVPEALGRAPGGVRPGLLVPPADPDALAAALRRWLTEPALRAELRAAARARRAHLPGWRATAVAVAAALDAAERAA